MIACSSFLCVTLLFLFGNKKSLCKENNIMNIIYDSITIQHATENGSGKIYTDEKAQLNKRKREKKVRHSTRVVFLRDSGLHIHVRDLG